MGSRSFAFSLRRQVRFSLQEVEEVLTIALVFGFVLSFRDWGVQSFDYVQGITNLAQAFLVVLVSLSAVLLAQKVFAVARGLTVEHKIWTRGLIASLLFGLFSNGVVLMLLSSSFGLKRVQRLGHSSKGVGVGELATVAGVGLFAHAVLVAIGGMLAAHLSWYWVDKLIVFNVVYLAYNILPLPHLVGSMIFLASRTWYVFTLFAVIAFVALALFGVPSFILSLAVGLIAIIVFFYWFEQHWV